MVSTNLIVIKALVKLKEDYEAGRAEFEETIRSLKDAQDAYAADMRTLAEQVAYFSVGRRDGPLERFAEASEAWAEVTLEMPLESRALRYDIYTRMRDGWRRYCAENGIGEVLCELLEEGVKQLTQPEYAAMVKELEQ